MTTLEAHKGFIEQVAKGNISPQKGNDVVMLLLEEYHKIDTTVEVLSECATCNNIYQDSFKIILAYLNNDTKSKVSTTAKSNKA
jgi:hypothetical protein